MSSFNEQTYWLRRQRQELALAGCTTCMEAKYIHLDLAVRYSVKANEEALELRIATTEPVQEPNSLANVVHMFWTVTPTSLPFQH